MAIHIGCSGWHYRHWRNNFYPDEIKPRDFLKCYASRFNTVEINNSFYRLPSEQALALWRDSVEQKFIFAVKASRYITYNKKLLDAKDSFSLFFDRISLLGDSLGPILFQLPPKWKFNAERLETFLSTLPKSNRYVMEFRHQDWVCDQAFELLEKYQIAFCIHDMPGLFMPEKITARHIYIRFHGSDGKYQGSYPSTILESWARKIYKWHQQKKDVYVYFNNDIEGFAPQNALMLTEMVDRLKS